jgi:Flp pilus assembly pilin Flp
MNILKNKKGQGLIEYLIVVSLMAVATITVVRVVSQNTSSTTTKSVRLILKRKT